MQNSKLNILVFQRVRTSNEPFQIGEALEIFVIWNFQIFRHSNQFHFMWNSEHLFYLHIKTIV